MNFIGRGRETFRQKHVRTVAENANIGNTSDTDYTEWV